MAYKITKFLNSGLIKISMRLKLAKVLGRPTKLMIEPTNICNLTCPTCPTGSGLDKRPKGKMSFENFKKIIEGLGKYLKTIILWNYGEPFLNKDIYKMIEFANQKGIFTLISTNGMCFKTEAEINKLIDSKLNHLIICLDGASQKTLEKFRGKRANFNKIVKAIEKIILTKEKKASKVPIVELQFIIMKHNEHEIPKIKKLAKSLKVNILSLKTCGINSPEEAKKFLPKDKKYVRKKGNYQCLNNPICPEIWQGAIISWNGDVLPCCYDIFSKHKFGNVFKEKSFSKIWNNRQFVNFRRKVLKNPQSIKICSRCPVLHKDKIYHQKLDINP